MPHLPVPEPTPLTDRVDAQLAEQRVFARLLTLLAGMALVLSVFGLYGVIAFTVTGRRREFGIRIALGADGTRISRLVLRSAAWIVLFGTASGLAGAYYLARLLESRLFGVTAVDAASYLGAAGLLALVATLACWMPARSAVKTDLVATAEGGIELEVQALLNRRGENRLRVPVAGRAIFHCCGEVGQRATLED